MSESDRTPSAAQTCPACRPAFDGQGAPDMCTQGDGCIIEEAFGPTESEKRRQEARSAARIDCLYDESVYLFYRRRRLRWQFVGYGNSVAALMSHGKVVGPFPSYVEAHRAL